MWWGFSQALDLLDELNSDDDNKQMSDGLTYNILLIGQLDSRHVLKTIAQKYRHNENVVINFYIYEPLLENIARELLFMALSLQSLELIGIAEKTVSFMEIYGNTLLRPATSKQLTKISKVLMHMVTDSSYAEKILPVVCIDKLKYKERDQLEVIFKYWASNDKSFNILEAWDNRIRKQLGVRYDSRAGVYDWDYQMRYKCFDADLLQFHEYKKFREKGISFYFDDTDPCIPNCTLASAIFSSGSKIQNYGYLGDITTGPYTTFGINCEDQDLLKKVNGKIYTTATNVTERNLMRIFHEIQYQEVFIPPHDSEDICPAVLLEDSLSKLKIQENVSPAINQSAPEKYESVKLNNCKIIFTSLSALSDFPKKREFENFFNLVFISQIVGLKLIQPEIFKMFKAGCRIIIDTPKFLLNFREEDLKKYKSDVDKLMKDSLCSLIDDCNSSKIEFLRYRVDK